MPFDLSTLVANQLARGLMSSIAPSQPKTLAADPLEYVNVPLSVQINPQSPPVFQLAEYPLPITPSVYANPVSSSNPSGSYASLYAFRQLIDPIPTFTKYYFASPNSTELVYNNLIHGANAAKSATYTSQVLASAKQTFDISSFAGLDGRVSDWWPVYATPSDWYDVTLASRFVSMDLNLASSEADNNPSILVLNNEQGAEPLSWQLGQASGQTSPVPLDAKTRLQTLHLKYLQVILARPWLDFEVFQLPDWYLSGQSPGYFSSGSPTDNAGVLPLLPTSLIIGLDTTVIADFGQDDQHFLREVQRNNSFLSLGPFLLQPHQPGAPPRASLALNSAGLASAPQSLFVVGWFSALVPRSPGLGLAHA